MLEDRPDRDEGNWRLPFLFSYFPGATCNVNKICKVLYNWQKEAIGETTQTMLPALETKEMQFNMPRTKKQTNKKYRGFKEVQVNWFSSFMSCSFLSSMATLKPKHHSSNISLDAKGKLIGVWLSVLNKKTFTLTLFLIL